MADIGAILTQSGREAVAVVKEEGQEFLAETVERLGEIGERGIRGTTEEVTAAVRPQKSGFPWGLVLIGGAAFLILRK